MEKRGWKSVDFAYIIGDGYVDHPSFGHAIISRLLESQWIYVSESFLSRTGKIRKVLLYLRRTATGLSGFCRKYGFDGKSLSCIEKTKKNRCLYPRRRDGKTPGLCGCVVYGNLIRQTYKKTPVIMGGIEASLRRMAHYDYWSDKLKRSILLDSGADIISYGMGEHSYHGDCRCV